MAKTTNGLQNSIKHATLIIHPPFLEAKKHQRALKASVHKAHQHYFQEHAFKGKHEPEHHYTVLLST